MCEIIKCKGDIPQPRFFHTSCIIGNKLYLFGGCNQKSQIFNDFYFLEFGSFNWVKINYETSLNPAPRFGHSMISIGIRLFIFGGKSERDQDCGDLSVFDTSILYL